MKKIALVAVLALLFVASVAQAGYYDFGGATVTILNQSHHPAHRFIEGNWPGNPQHGTAFGLHEEAEELFNVNIEFAVYNWSEYFTMLPTRVISGDAANDIWIMTSGHVWPLLAQGLLYPVSEILPEEHFLSLPGLGRGMTDYISFQGQRYAFGVAGVAGLLGLHTVAYNKDLFEELGLPDLLELYQDDEWTWEKMGEIAALATRTVDDRTLFGMAGPGHPAVFYGLAYNNDQAAFVTEVDGRWMYTGTDPKYLEALQQYREWVDAGIMLSGTAINDHVRSLIAGEHAMIMTDFARIRSNAGPAVDRTVRLGFVPFPRGPRSDEYYFTSMSFDGALTLPVISEHPEGLMQLAEFLYPMDDYYFMLDEMIRELAQDRQSAAMIQEFHDNWTGFTARMRSNAGLDDHLSAESRALSGQVPAASALQEIASAQQATLDEFWNW